MLAAYGLFLPDRSALLPAGPELVHQYHFVPCAGVRYYAYHTSQSPVEPIVRRKR